MAEIQDVTIEIDISDKATIGSDKLACKPYDLPFGRRDYRWILPCWRSRIENLGNQTFMADLHDIVEGDRDYFILENF
jgi:hypothetical protein